jgi:2-polyprenyl-6-methoxyphenol hydroxylase-like FAD-dependent oxidoreductase
MDKARFLIAGAGLGGLAAALALLKKGFDAELYEQAPQLAEFGAGVQVSANSARVLYALGLGDELSRIGTHVGAREMRLWSTGQTWPGMALGTSAEERYGFPHFTVHRADLQGVLIEAVRREKPGAIHLDARCTGFEQAAHGVTLKLEGGRTVRGDVLVGADGIHSLMREQLFGAGKPQFTGCVAWRGLAPAEKLSAHLRRNVVSHWVCKGAHLIQYPVRQGRLINMIGVLERDDWRIESWSVQGTHQECAADFAGWHADVQELIRQVAVPYKWALMAREPLLRWTQGRATLLGDACHPALPYLAQGAAMAIEDALVLARCADAFCDDLERALLCYEAVRAPRTARIVRATIENLASMHDASLAEPASAAQHITDENREERTREKYDWLYGYDAVNVALPGTGS